MKKIYFNIACGYGIGLATALRFGREGYRVVLTARNASRLQAQVAELASKGIQAEWHVLDASDAKAVADLVGRFASDIDILHYNGGVLHYGADGSLQTRSIEDESVASLASDTTINITSALAAVQAAWPSMASRGKGTFLLTGGGLGVHPSGSFLTLSVGKAGLRAAVLALFEPMKARGVHIATVTVGRLVSPGSEQSTAVAEAFWQLHAQPQESWTPETVFA